MTHRLFTRGVLRLLFIDTYQSVVFTMHVVVIGAGAAGMASAHYLAKTHQVTVLESQAILGGNVRTLNRNVESKTLPEGVFLDNGVIEFHRRHSPGLKALVQELDLKLRPLKGGSTSLYLEGGKSFHMPGAILDQQCSVLSKGMQFAQLAWLMRHLLPIVARMSRRRSGAGNSVADFLGDDNMSRWIKMLLMYGYSMPYAKIDKFPAALALHTLRQGSIGTQWVCLADGVYRYMEEIISRAGDSLRLKTGKTISAVTRAQNGVTVECSDEILQADRVVFATPPDQVLPLLADADSQEKLWFAHWQANYAETVIHTDESIYADWPLHSYSEFDVFEKNQGADAGYNAYLNSLCGLPRDRGTQYFLAYNLEDRIDPKTILDRQRHHTPYYTPQAVAFVDQIQRENGRNNTFHAGAYLYNGLHEGAIQSALAVKALLQ